MTASKIIQLLLLQFLCVFIVIQIGLVMVGFSFITILFWSYLLFVIIYVGFLAPRWKKKDKVVK
ncbi:MULTISPECIES: hypothetical protein [Macrococcoides]|uniref:Uncharacterized protein n=2 Tax=Macrococcoides canis TaxID=1855823 RepID=A0A0D6DR63_9STAP|nr:MULTISPECIES: hypothetical protein [Macrococcus]ARQ05707.1 hypothetical protein MCCS_00350 [Macrococcus canis]MBC9873928.1 hypothetical protein [Macrococcus bohemicus]MEB8171638.1 hypothetical protein [Macrococcus caseolyticus]PKE50738.1 hypothetical protein CW672_04425 [Macrococcus caseolyticus]PKE65711.1 hypothetical protein CW674_05245 [Macrococcus caseolyticus]